MASLDETTLDDLATRLANLSPEDAAQVHRTVTGLQAERARVEEERIANLRAQTDEEVVFEVLALADDHRVANAMTDQALALLRDAGFVRHLTLEAVYRAGYERYGYDHLGDGHPLMEEDHPSYISGRDYDLDALVKKGA